ICILFIFSLYLFFLNFTNFQEPNHINNDALSIQKFIFKDYKLKHNFIKQEVALGDILRDWNIGNYVEAVAFSPDGNLVAFGGFDDNLIVKWIANETERIFSSPYDGLVFNRILSVEFSPNSKYLAFSTANGIIYVLDSQSLNITFAGRKHQGEINALAISPDSKILATAGSDRSVKFWNLRNGLFIKEFNLEQQIYSLDFSPDGTKIVSGLYNGLTVLDYPSNDIYWEHNLGGNRDVLATIYSPDGEYIIAIQFDTIHLMNSTDETLINSLTPYPGSFQFSAKFSPIGQLFVTTSGDHYINFWDMTNFKQSGRCLPASWKENCEVAVLYDHSSQVNSVDFSPDGSMLISGSDDASVKIWNLIDSTPNDQDADGMNDSWEENHELNSSDFFDKLNDQDEDELLNYLEHYFGSSPLDNDTDSDGLEDYLELISGTSLLDTDSDSDKIPDGWEYKNGLDPTNPQDANDDPDNDGHSNLKEFQGNSDPNDELSLPKSESIFDRLIRLIIPVLIFLTIILLLLVIGSLIGFMVKSKRFPSLKMNFKLNKIKKLDVDDIKLQRQMKKTGFDDVETYEEAIKVGASTPKEYKLVKRTDAPNFETAKKVYRSGFANYQEFNDALALGVESKFDLDKIKDVGAPNFPTYQEMLKGGFSNFRMYQLAEKVGAKNFWQYKLVYYYKSSNYKEAEAKYVENLAEKITKYEKTATTFSLDDVIKYLTKEMEIDVPKDILFKTFFNLAEEFKIDIKWIDILNKLELDKKKAFGMIDEIKHFVQQSDEEDIDS
ncbi:MAG: hypothetical protein ACXAC7_15985, partial [Candidatus Hodarchaeales archaeon]